MGGPAAFALYTTALHRDDKEGDRDVVIEHGKLTCLSTALRNLKWCINQLSSAGRKGKKNQFHHVWVKILQMCMHVSSEECLKFAVLCPNILLQELPDLCLGKYICTDIVCYTSFKHCFPGLYLCLTKM